ncbi:MULTISPECIES: MFS transporter [unclassified Nocardia]|uniref:MFS transporter n=1 Tax=unclassified Nocardia TaxID=2637762 RepID=UPI001CE42448|nr:MULTISPECIES: MFS transporter [unclassified Nocardia]
MTAATSFGRSPAPPGSTVSGSRRELAAATVGAVVESFDWSVYVVFAAFFAPDLFGSDSVGSMLAVYGGFAVGFVARPVGSIVFGRISDRRGRKVALLVSMSIIAIASFAIAVMPGTATIGAWSAVLVIALRIVQGLAYGGEGPTVAAYVAETAPPRRRFLFSAISYGGIMFGSLLVFGFVAILTAWVGADALRDGGWRVAFAAGGLLGLLAVWVRTFAPESAEFERGGRAASRRRSSIASIFRNHPHAVIALFLNTLGGTVSYYFALVYLPKYAAALGVAKAATATGFMTIVLAIVLAGMLVAGALADRFGLLRVIRIGNGLNMIGVLPLTVAMASGLVPFQIAAIGLGLGAATSMAVSNVVGALLMPVEIRAVGTGIVTATTIAAFGGTFPMVAEAFTGAGLTRAVPYYVLAAAIAGFAGTFTMTKVRCFTDTMRETVHVRP